MKKIILTALVAVASLAANAQIWGGGTIGFNTAKITDKVGGVKTELKTTDLNINPEIGYSINENWDVALSIGYYHGKNTQKTFGRDLSGIFDNGFADNLNAFKLSPYVRYSFAKAGDFAFFVDGGFSYIFNHVSSDEKNYNVWDIFIQPGIKYSLSEKVTLVAKTGNLSYVFAKHGEKKLNAFDLGLSSAVTFGAYVNF